MHECSITRKGKESSVKEHKYEFFLLNNLNLTLAQFAGQLKSLKSSLSFKLKFL